MQEIAIVKILSTAPAGLRAVDIAYELGQEANPALLFALQRMEKAGTVAVDRGVDVKYRLKDGVVPAQAESMIKIQPVQVWRVGNKEFDTEAEAQAYLNEHGLEMRISEWVESNIPKAHKTWSTHKKVILAWEMSKNE